MVNTEKIADRKKLVMNCYENSCSPPHSSSHSSGTGFDVCVVQNDTIKCLLLQKQQQNDNKNLAMQYPLQRRHNEPDVVSNHQPHDCLLNCLFRHKSKKTSKRRVTGLCAGNSPVTGEFPAQRASNAKNVSIWWRHYDGWICLNHLYQIFLHN